MKDLGTGIHCSKKLLISAKFLSSSKQSLKRHQQSSQSRIVHDYTYNFSVDCDLTGKLRFHGIVHDSFPQRCL